MAYLLIVIGTIIYVSIVLDILKTTLSMQGGGWLTSNFSHLFWKLMLKLSGRNGKSKLLARAGFYLLILIILIWVSSLALSLFLLLQSDIDSVVNSAKIPASALEKLYYSGYILSTLGIGDFTPSNNLWRIITDLYSFTGLILITMSVTYFIPVLSAIIKQRKLGINLSSLGNSPQEIILNAWNGIDYDFFKLQLLTLSDALLEHNQNHRAYPVIHFFHNNDKEHSVVLQIARLHEAICILEKCLSPECSIPKQEISSIKTALNNYINVVREVSNINFINSSPITPDLNMLKEKNMLRSNLNGFDFSETVQEDRQFFLTLVVNDGWEWKDVF
ncbi:potassium channel family protein [Gillisia sp. CAL575]|uniref:potassium channel family protein n=1 Tax=Gillisia sp. CAL575 TaxID=985255 RepID=UPI00039F84FF|nr:potassium channel family protein [Gillisia sp. CAL575]